METRDTFQYISKYTINPIYFSDDITMFKEYR